MTEFSAFWNGTSVGDATAAPYDANTEWANYIRWTVGLGNTRNNSGVVLGNGSEATQLDSLQVTENSPAAMNVLVNIGTAIVHGTTYTNDSTITLTVAANASGNPRIDTIILRKTWASQEVRAAILTGTPAGTPAAPALTQSDGVTWEIPLADIAVANGAVSITNANITPRATYANAADGVYLDRLLNSYPSTLTNGDIATLNASANRSISSLSAPSQTRPPRFALGTWQARTAAAGIGRALQTGIGNIKVDAAAARGYYASLRAGTLSGNPAASAFEFPQFDTIAVLLQAATASGNVPAFIHAAFPQQFGQMCDTSLLAAPAAGISVGAVNNGVNLGYRTLLIEYFLRSAVVATNDTCSLRFGGDTTAANWRSYRININGTVPTLSGSENIGATAGIQINIPGSTAPAGAYAFGLIWVSNANLRTQQRHWIGFQFERITDVTGGFIIHILSGLWNNAAQDLDVINVVSNGGSNITTDSYLNVFTKQV